MARMVGPSGRVVVIDVVEPLVRQAGLNVARADGDLLATGCLSLRQGDGWAGARWRRK